jgi:hypothetical protein
LIQVNLGLWWLSALDKIPDHRQGAFRRIGNHGVPAICERLDL